MAIPADQFREVALRVARRAQEREVERTLLRPQVGPQFRFYRAEADIVIGGGAAGGGKTWSLLRDPLKHRNVPGFNAVIFRKTFSEIDQQGGMWEEARGIYPLVGGIPQIGPRRWVWPSGAAIKFDYLLNDKTCDLKYGLQAAMIGFDQLEGFSEYQFFFMLNRNRSKCGVRPYMRATCNPDPDSFLITGPDGWGSGFLGWWIGEDGYAIPERAGAVRWFYRIDDRMHWYGSRAEAEGAHPEMAAEAPPLSVAFIPATLADNQILMQRDPGYKAKLMALDRVRRARLLGGNWKVRATAGAYFDRSEVTMVDRAPEGPDWVWARSWDLAATVPTTENPDPDWTAGILMGRNAKTDQTCVAHAEHVRERSGAVRSLLRATAVKDGPGVRITIPQDPGQAGKAQAEELEMMLAELAPVSVKIASRDKVSRASPFAAAWQNHKVLVVRGAWNDVFFRELEGFPDAAHDDLVDACSDAYNELAHGSQQPAAAGRPR